MFKNKITEYYNLLKAKFIEFHKLLKARKIDKLLIIIGILGVVIGLVLSVPIINQLFAWLILFGVYIKFYDFVEETQRNIIPYDFNNLLPPPKK